MKAHQKRDLVIGIVTWSLFIVLIVVGFFLIFKPGNNKKEPPQLDMSVSKNLVGIRIVNNETSTLTGCKLTLNNKYSTRVSIVDSEYRTYAYSDFTTTDGSRFDIQTTDPKELFIQKCLEEPDRYGAVVW